MDRKAVLAAFECLGRALEGSGVRLHRLVLESPSDDGLPVGRLWSFLHNMLLADTKVRVHVRLWTI